MGPNAAEPDDFRRSVAVRRVGDSADTLITARSSMAERRWTGRRRAQRFQATIPHAHRMHVQTEFPISPAASDPEVHWAGRAHADASTAIETVFESVAARPRAGSKGASMKFTEDSRQATAVSLIAAIVAALAQISGAALTGATANVRQAD